MNHKCKTKGCDKRVYSSGYCRECYNKEFKENLESIPKRWDLS